MNHPRIYGLTEEQYREQLDLRRDRDAAYSAMVDRTSGMPHRRWAHQAGESWRKWEDPVSDMSTEQVIRRLEGRT